MKKLLITLSLLILHSYVHAYDIEMNFKQPFEEQDRARLLQIAERIKILVSTDEFKSKARQFTNYSCTQAYNFPQGVSDLEEALDFIETAVINISISFFRANNSVVASTGIDSISFNKNMFETNSDAAVANTLFHESLHALNFRHCNKNNIRFFPKIKRSIPYKFGDYIEELY